MSNHMGKYSRCNKIPSGIGTVNLYGSLGPIPIFTNISFSYRKNKLAISFVFSYTLFVSSVPV